MIPSYELWACQQEMFRLYLCLKVRFPKQWLKSSAFFYFLRPISNKNKFIQLSFTLQLPLFSSINDSFFFQKLIHSTLFSIFLLLLVPHFKRRRVFWFWVLLARFPQSLKFIDVKSSFRKLFHFFMKC